MKFLDSPFDKEPDFVNELGVKWWKDESITNYAQKEDIHGTVLNAICYFIEETNGHRTRVLVSKNKEIIEEDQTLDGMGSKIDMRKMLKRFDT